MSKKKETEKEVKFDFTTVERLPPPDRQKSGIYDEMIRRIDLLPEGVHKLELHGTAKPNDVYIALSDRLKDTPDIAVERRNGAIYIVKQYG
jgi:hypothetical protein